MNISRTLGAILLIAGCCIGAGMLGLPLVSFQAGFLPTTCMLFVSWIFMLATSLLLLEATLYHQTDVNLITIVGAVFGNPGKVFVTLLFIFLFESLLVAYLSGSSQIIKVLFSKYTTLPISGWLGGLFSCFLLGSALFIGTTATDRLNRYLMFGLVLSYFLLVGSEMPYIQTENLTKVNWEASLLLLPTLIISLGYHNLVPSLTTYLKRDQKALTVAFIVGSLIPFFIYLLFEYVVLGGMSPQDSLSHESLISDILRKGRFIEAFSLFAIWTSFLGVGLSFIDFLADGLQIPKSPPGKLILCTLTLLPALAFSIFDPGIFLTAINYAGAFGATILFGVFPPLIIWKMGKRNNPILFGGKVMLSLLITASLFVFLMQFWQEFIA